MSNGSRASGGPEEHQPMAPGLYIVATPIGNLGDITLRALDTLRGADVIIAEDTRHTRKLLTRFEIDTPMISCHKFNEAARVETVLGRVRDGQAVAMVSDSGTPLVSDPGARIVSACRRDGLAVTIIPGPSSVIAAVALSGFGGDAFRFEGFLSHKSAARKRRLDELKDESVPVVFFESPYRLLKLMNEVLEVLGSERELYVGRELTKQYEESLWGMPSEIIDAFANRNVKGELVVVLAPSPRKSAKERRAIAEQSDG